MQQGWTALPKNMMSCFHHNLFLLHTSIMFLIFTFHPYNHVYKWILTYLYVRKYFMHVKLHSMYEQLSLHAQYVYK